MRIVGGEYRGSALFAPKGHHTRPTSDRVREALFNILTHSIEAFELRNIRVLDLFAGTGALGLEALSRGASFCLFIDNAAEARGILRQNIEALGLNGVTKLLRRDATDLGKPGSLGQFDLMFADPPYGKGLAENALKSAYAGGWLTDDAIYVIEERTSNVVTLPDAFHMLDQRVYGDTKLIIGRLRA